MLKSKRWLKLVTRGASEDAMRLLMRLSYVSEQSLRSMSHFIDFGCLLDVCFWHKADMPVMPNNVRFLG